MKIELSLDEAKRLESVLGWHIMNFKTHMDKSDKVDIQDLKDLNVLRDKVVTCVVHEELKQEK